MKIEKRKEKLFLVCVATICCVINTKNEMAKVFPQLSAIGILGRNVAECSISNDDAPYHPIELLHREVIEILI